MSLIYYIRCGASGLIKIGRSVNVRARLSQLQTSSTSALTLLATEAETHGLEAVRHEQFGEARERGEWFRPVPALLAHIATLGEPLRIGRPAALTIQGTTLCDRQLAAALQCSRAYPTQMRLGMKPITLDIALAIHDHNGDQVGPLASATDEEIEVLRRFVLAAPYFEAARPKTEAA